MTPAIASVIFSAIAILVTIFGTLRIARKTAVLQEWNYRQKVGEELGSLSNLLTQSQLLTQREQQRNDMVEREAKRLLLSSPNDHKIISALKALEKSKVVAGEKVKEHAAVRKSLADLWQIDKPVANQLATVQKLKASVQHELTQLQDLETDREARYKTFMASAAEVR